MCTSVIDALLVMGI